MKISLKELKALISEAVDKKLRESDLGGGGSGEGGGGGVDWEKMKVLQATKKLQGRWAVIMTAMELSGGDPEKSLALLKSAVATLEIHKSPPQQEPPDRIASHEEMTDMSKLF